MSLSNSENLPEISTAGKDKLSGAEFNTYIYRLISRQLDGVVVDGYNLNYVDTAEHEAGLYGYFFEVKATDEEGERHAFIYETTDSAEVVHMLLDNQNV